MKILAMSRFVVIGILWVNFVNINLDFDEEDPGTIILINCLVWHLKNARRLKKQISEGSMPMAWHPERWCNFYMSEDEKKIEHICAE